MMALARRFRREIAVAVVGLLATAIAFAVGPIWGWRALGTGMLATAAIILFVAGGAYLMPGTRAGYADGRAAFAIALIAAATGFGLILRAGDFALRTCVALPYSGCGSICTNRDLVSVASPTRTVRAIRFVRSCEAPASLSTHVSIVAMGEPLADGAGNAFIVDGKVDVVLLWIGGRHLAIAGTGMSTPRLQKNSLGGIRISYDERAR